MNVQRSVDSETLHPKKRDQPPGSLDAQRRRSPLAAALQEMGEVVFMADKARREFVRNLRAYRERKFKYASEFARILGIDPQRYRTWENPKSDAEPSLHYLRLICTNLGVSPTFLLMNLTEEWGEQPIILPKKEKRTRRSR